MRVSNLLMLISGILVGCGFLVILLHPAVEKPTYTPADIASFVRLPANPEPWKLTPAQISVNAMRQRETEEKNQEEFENSPLGLKIKELERRMRNAEFQANQAIGIAGMPHY